MESRTQPAGLIYFLQKKKNSCSQNKMAEQATTKAVAMQPKTKQWNSLLRIRTTIRKTTCKLMRDASRICIAKCTEAKYSQVLGKNFRPQSTSATAEYKLLAAEALKKTEDKILEIKRRFRSVPSAPADPPSPLQTATCPCMHASFPSFFLDFHSLFPWASA